MSIEAEDFRRAVAEGRFGYGEIVRHLIDHSGASGAIVWDCHQEPFKIVAEHYSGQPTSLWCTKAQHDQLLKQVVVNRRGAVITNDANGESSGDPPILVAPIPNQASDEDSAKLVELLFSDTHKVPDPTEKLTQLIGFCNVLFPSGETTELANINHGVPATASKPRLSLGAFSQFSTTIHRSIDLVDTCSNVTNESRLLTQCDRVTVVLKERGRFRVTSISGQPSVNRRSSTVQAIESLAQAVLETGNEFWFPDEAKVAPQVEVPLDEYLEISSTRSLAIIPVYDRDINTTVDPEEEKTSEPRVIGGLVFEHAREQWNVTEIQTDLRVVAEHCATAIRNAQGHQSLFLYPLWKLLGRSRVLAAPRVLPKLLVLTALLFAAAIFLACWQTPFYVAAEGELLPKERRLVFSHSEGEVVDVLVNHGDVVEKGQVLVRLNSEDLDLRIEDVNGRLETLVERKGSIQRSKFEKNREQKQNAEQNLRAIQAEVDSLSLQLKELEQIRSRLNVESPIGGQVITWDVEQNLEGRVVSPQNQLMEVADTDGPWQLVLEVSDKYADEVLAAWQQLDAEEGDTLRVRFSIASDPKESYDGQVTSVGNEIQLTDDNQQVLRVKVDLDSSAIALKKARTGVSAKIYTGNDTSVGYLWLSDIPDAFRRHVLFYFTD